MGVTQGIRQQELLSISSGSLYVLHVGSFADLSLVTRLLERGKLISHALTTQVVVPRRAGT